MSKRKENSPFGDEYQKIIDQNKRRKDLDVDENNERIKRPSKVVPNKGGNLAKRKAAEARKRTSKKKTARQEALRMIRKGMIPASPTR
jgi:hypothetical protein